MKPVIIMASVFSGFLMCCSAQSKSLTIGDAVPVFSLRDQNDSLFHMADYLGKKILVIYFYPKDESMVCTKESCSFRDSLRDFSKADAIVIGINSGTVESHKNFSRHYQLPFTLLSDPENRVLKMFGVKSKLIFTGRETFVIDKSGKIVFTYDSFTSGTGHVTEALAFIKKMH